MERNWRRTCLGGAALIALVGAIASGVVRALLKSMQDSGGGSHHAPRVGDFDHFYYAAAAMREGQDIYLSGQRGYLYPPLFAFLLQPLAALELRSAARVWLAINATVLAAAILMMAREMVRRWEVRPARWGTIVVAGGAAVALHSSIDSVLVLMQTDGLLALAFALGLAWCERRPRAAGVVLGMAANIKYLPLLMLPYFLLRRRVTTGAWMVGSFVGFLLLPMVSTGVERGVAYAVRAGHGLAAMAGLAHRSADDPAIESLAWVRSVSITSAVARMIGAEGLSAGVVGVTGLVALACMLGAAWMYRRRGFHLLAARPADAPRQNQKIAALEWAGVITAIVAFGPQTTARHMMLLLPLASLSAALAAASSGWGQRVPLLLALAALGAEQGIPPPGRGMGADIWRFVGGPSWLALGVLGLCVWRGLALAARGDDPDGAATTQNEDAGPGA